jgi:transposase InsO family protein
MITEKAKERCRMLAFWEKHGDVATLEAFGISRRTLYRWQAALRKAGGKLEGLNARSTTPHRRRKRNVPDRVIERIITLRTAHPRLGKEKLHAIVTQEGYGGSVSTIGRILADLKKQGRTPQPVRYSFYGKTANLIERAPMKRKKKLRRPSGYRVLEVDTLVRFIDGMKRYILTGVDTEKRTAFAAAYTSHGSASAADFLEKARMVLPDCPEALQTDNGSEFALHFAEACKEHDLTHFHTYPKSPKMNAHVERFNRTLEEELLRFHRALLRDDVRAFNHKLMDWLLWYNAERPHYALGQVSPFRFMMASLPAQECQMWWTHTSPCPKA